MAIFFMIIALRYLLAPNKSSWWHGRRTRWRCSTIFLADLKGLSFRSEGGTKGADNNNKSNILNSSPPEQWEVLVNFLKGSSLPPKETVSRGSKVHGLKRRMGNLLSLCDTFNKYPNSQPKISLVSKHTRIHCSLALAFSL